jgi:hypothetical protein
LLSVSVLFFFLRRIENRPRLGRVAVSAVMVGCQRETLVSVGDVR